MPYFDRLKQYREKKELTQDDVAAFFGENFTRQAVSKWERGESFPEAEKLLVLSVKLDITLDELFSDELAYLRKAKGNESTEELYPGLYAGMKRLIDILVHSKWRESKFENK